MNEHPISDEVLEIIQVAINRNENWMTYNNSLYFIDKGDVQFFNEKTTAEEFVSNNSSDFDNYNLIYVKSLMDVFRLIPYGEELSKNLNILSSKNVSTMSEQELAFVEKQLKKIGLAEAFTPGLIEQMKKGELYIKQPFEKNYDGDEAKAILHFKKSDSSNLYFFNKYDLQVRKDGQTNEVNRTFYINNFNRNGNNEDQNLGKYFATFTFKAAFNYLSGRPVLNTYQNQKGERYQSWDVLNPKKLLPNGKMEEKHYHENYGFDLEKVLKNYSIKEMATAEYKERLLQSLQRGNLQSVMFVRNDSRTEKHLISPDIPLGAIKVYDENKTRIPTEKLVEKGFIGKDLAEKLSQRIEEIKQKNGQTASSESKQEIKKENENLGQSVSKDSKQSNKQKDQKLGKDDDGKKPTKKQKQKIQ
jgi:hypothetical protein